LQGPRNAPLPRACTRFEFFHWLLGSTDLFVWFDVSPLETRSCFYPMDPVVETTTRKKIYTYFRPAPRDPALFCSMQRSARPAGGCTRSSTGRADALITNQPGLPLRHSSRRGVCHVKRPPGRRPHWPSGALHLNSTPYRNEENTQHIRCRHKRSHSPKRDFPRLHNTRLSEAASAARLEESSMQGLQGPAPAPPLPQGSDQFRPW
jgi:hypothetical protein